MSSELDIGGAFRQMIREEITRALMTHSPGKGSAVQCEDAKSVADRTGISVNKLQEYRSSGGGPPFFKVDRRVVYNTADVDDWLLSQKVSPESSSRGHGQS